MKLPLNDASQGVQKAAYIEAGVVAGEFEPNYAKEGDWYVRIHPDQGEAFTLTLEQCKSAAQMDWEDLHRG